MLRPVLFWCRGMSAYTLFLSIIGLSPRRLINNYNLHGAVENQIQPFPRGLKPTSHGNGVMHPKLGDWVVIRTNQAKTCVPA